MSLHVSNLTKQFGDVTILKDVSFILNDGERWGLIGPNGCGKTTLLDIIAGHLAPDAGSVRLTPANTRLGYLEQALSYASAETVSEALGHSDAELARAEHDVELAAAALTAADSDETDEVAATYAEALTRLQRLCAARPSDHEVQRALAGLGLSALPASMPVATLSGGQKTRLGLARVLLSRPDILLLDEPTNNLDIGALRWLEEWLSAYRGAVLLVSHDREFLDRSVTAMLELDPATHAVTYYPGQYSDYLDAKQRQQSQQWTEYKDQQEHIAQTNAEIRRLANYARNIENGTINYAIRKIAKGIARRAVVQQRRLERELEQHTVEKPVAGWQMKLDLGAAPPSGQAVLLLDDLTIGYGDHALLSHIDQAIRAGERVALLGPNGSGKTTLLRVINGALTPQAGRLRLGSGAKLGYFAQEGETLDHASTPLATIRAQLVGSETEARSFLHYFLFAGDEVFTPIGALSYGERARLALARLVAAGCNFLLLDEPLNHLDIPSRARFEQALANFEGTVLAVVHDRYFVRQFATRIWSIEDGQLHERYDIDDVG